MRELEELFADDPDDDGLVQGDDGPPDGSSADALLRGASRTPEEEAVETIAALLR